MELPANNPRSMVASAPGDRRPDALVKVIPGDFGYELEGGDRARHRIGNHQWTLPANTCILLTKSRKRFDLTEQSRLVLKFHHFMAGFRRPRKELK
jgi:hypothetical protein